MTSGKVKTLFSDKEKTEALFPRTKTSAISNEDGIGLDALMENLIYSSNENLNQDTVPLNADTLGGYPAEDYASKLYVKEQILKVQEGTGVDLSEFATKEDLASIDFPVDSVNGKTGTVQLSASDVGAASLINIGSYNGDLDDYVTLSNTVCWISANTVNNPTGTWGACETWDSGIGGVIQRITYLNGVMQRLRTGNGWEEWKNVVDAIGAASVNDIGTNKVFNKLTDIGITTFPTTMQTVANAMPNNSTLMLDSRDIITGGAHEISNLGIADAGMYTFIKGNSNARISLLNIYGATSATISYMNYGCYASTNDEVVWIRGERPNTTHPNCRYRYSSTGVYEWINPPMIAGSEYRTIEKYQGKYVYAKLVNFGALPNDTTKQVGFCSDGCTNVVSITAILDNGCVIHGGTGKDLNMGQSYNITLNCTKYNIRILTDYDFSSRSAYVLVKYTLD